MSLCQTTFHLQDCEVLHCEIKFSLKKNKNWANKWFNLFVNNVENLRKKGGILWTKSGIIDLRFYEKVEKMNGIVVV
jgi:hypothetical protein